MAYSSIAAMGSIVGLPSGILGPLVRGAGLRFITEGFVDRRYDEDGQLVPRSRGDALLTEPEEIDGQLRRLIEGGEVETLCVHGDHENAVALARRVRRVFDLMGVQPRSFI